MHVFPGILSIAILLTGWYYIFYSKAADRLSSIENAGSNRVRQRNRRVAGVLMLPMAVFFYAGSYIFNPDYEPVAFVMMWLGVMALLLTVLGLAVNDLRLTAKLRRKERV